VSLRRLMPDGRFAGLVLLAPSAYCPPEVLAGIGLQPVLDARYYPTLRKFIQEVRTIDDEQIVL
jgi:hypothetical protein